MKEQTIDAATMVSRELWTTFLTLEKVEILRGMEMEYHLGRDCYVPYEYINNAVLKFILAAPCPPNSEPKFQVDGRTLTFKDGSETDIVQDIEARRIDVKHFRRRLGDYASRFDVHVPEALKPCYEFTEVRQAEGNIHIHGQVVFEVQ